MTTRTPSFQATLATGLIIVSIGAGAFVFGVSTEKDWLAQSGFLTVFLTVIALGLTFALHPGVPLPLQELKWLLKASLSLLLAAGAFVLCGWMGWDWQHPGWYFPLVNVLCGLTVLALIWRRRTTLTPDGRVAGVILAVLWLSFAVWLGSEDEKANNVFAVPLALVVASIADALWRRVVPVRFATSGAAKAGAHLAPLFAGLCAAVLLMNGLDDRDAHAYVLSGNAWRAKGDNDRAIADYSEAIRLDPKHQWAYTDRGIAWRAKGDNDRAIADYSEAIRLDPKYQWAYTNRGNAWRSKGDNDRAIADYTEAIRLDPKYGWAYANRGYAWRAKGKRGKALADFNNAIRADPKNHGLYNSLAWTLSTDDKFAGDPKRAVQLARQACELTSWRNPYYLNTLAVAYAQAGNFGEAVRWQEKALEFPEFASESEGAAKRLALYRSGKAYRN